MEEPPHGPRAVDLGRVVQLRRDRLEPGQDRDQHEREERPDADQAERPEDPVRSEPEGRPAGEPGPDDQVVRDPVLVVEDPAPDDHRERDRDHVREEGDAPNDQPAPEILVQQQRRRYPEDELRHHRHQGVDHAQPEAVPELAVVEQEVHVVVEPDPGTDRLDRVLLVEAEPEVVDHGVAEQRHEGQHGRDHQDDARQVPARAQPDRQASRSSGRAPVVARGDTLIASPQGCWVRGFWVLGVERPPHPEPSAQNPRLRLLDAVLRVLDDRRRLLLAGLHRIGRRHALGDDGGHHLAHDAGVREVRRPGDLLVRLLEQEERPRELVGQVLVLKVDPAAPLLDDRVLLVDWIVLHPLDRRVQVDRHGEAEVANVLALEDDLAQELGRDLRVRRALVDDHRIVHRLGHRTLPFGPSGIWIILYVSGFCLSAGAYWER